MRMARIGVLSALGAFAGCGHEGASAAGAWTGTMTDATGVRSLTGNCNQRDGETTIVDCVFSVTNPDGNISQGALDGVMSAMPASSEGALSYAIGVAPPPCRINVSGDAAVTTGSIEGTYRGASDCTADAIRDGRLRLVR